MKIYQYILLFLFISVAARIYYLFFRKPTQNKDIGPKPVKKKIKKTDEGSKGSKEGFESLDNCLEQGYPDDFCKRIPIEACVSNCPVGTFMPKTFTVSNM